MKKKSGGVKRRGERCWWWSRGEWGERRYFKAVQRCVCTDGHLGTRVGVRKIKILRDATLLIDGDWFLLAEHLAGAVS